MRGPADSYARQNAENNGSSGRRPATTQRCCTLRGHPGRLTDLQRQTPPWQRTPKNTLTLSTLPEPLLTKRPCGRQFFSKRHPLPRNVLLVRGGKSRAIGTAAVSSQHSGGSGSPVAVFRGLFTTEERFDLLAEFVSFRVQRLEGVHHLQIEVSLLHKHAKGVKS